jgi:hypothetical protein
MHSKFEIDLNFYNKKALYIEGFFRLSNYRKIWGFTFSLYKLNIDLGSTLTLKHMIKLTQYLCW